MIYTPLCAAVEPLPLQENKSITPTPLELAASMATPIVTTAAGIQALDSYNYIDAGWIQELPAATHLSSIAGSYVAGAVGGAVTEKLVNRLASAGRNQAAERVRRIGNTVTMLGSLACQVAIETTLKGVGDKWDVVAGVIATVPGIIAGKGFAKTLKRPGSH